MGEQENPTSMELGRRIPHPIATQMPAWQMGYPDHQPHPDFQNYEPSKSTDQSDYPSHGLSFLSHPYQTCPSNAEDHLPTRSNEDWQTQDLQYYQSPVCPDQHQYQSQPQQAFEPPLNENQYGNSIEGNFEGLIASQQSMRSCLKSNDELAPEMQVAHDEHKSSIAEMIKQASLLADIMKEIQEDKAKSQANEKGLDEEGVLATEEGQPSSIEQESEMPPEEQEERGTVEVESAEEETQTEEEILREILEWVNDEPQVKEEKVIESCAGVTTALPKDREYGENVTNGGK